MKKKLKESYDFRGGVRGKYVARSLRSKNVRFLAPDILKRFPTSASVNRALRSLVRRARVRPRGKAR
jgi:hypothetical protein